MKQRSIIGKALRNRANLRSPPVILLVLATAFFGPAVERACAWNDAGHMVIDLIAYDLMDAHLRGKVVALLKQHPRFEQHFLGRMPQDIWVADSATKDEWIFAFAGHWPDLVRDHSEVVTDEDAAKFNRPLWHYVDSPIYLDQTDENNLVGHNHGNFATEPPADRDSASMNIMQAIENSSRIVADGSAAAADRAVHLCWLCHLLGDCHQPLHVCALHTVNRFGDGDQGGNLIMVAERKSLHSYWDGRILDTRDYHIVCRAARQLEGDETLRQAGVKAAQNHDGAAWVAEGREIARKHVYTEAILKAVAAAESQPNLDIIELPAGYDRAAREVAKRQAVDAGYRLADLLRRLLQN